MVTVKLLQARDLMGLGIAGAGTLITTDAQTARDWCASGIAEYVPEDQTGLPAGKPRKKKE